jgi:dTDP-4-amino-4,6-dideoxygalactose transaminase
MDCRIPLTEPDLGAEEIEAVSNVLKSKWLTMGPVTAEFEKQFAAKMNVKHAIAVNSCTAALHLANLACGVGPDDEVICPDLTFVASANASRYTGAKVVFAGVKSLEDLTIDPADIEAHVTPRTKAVTVVHYAGFACQMNEILDVAQRYNLKVIEDCAHAPFAWESAADGSRKYVGSIGDVGCFSFFSNKNMTTGEGGMVTTNDDDIAAKVKLLRSHGMTTLTYDRDRGHASRYDVVAVGYNYRLDEIRSAIGLCQLAKIDLLNEERRQVLRWYRDALTDGPSIKVPFRHRDERQATPHIMPVFTTRRQEDLKDLFSHRGVQVSKHYDLVTSFSAYSQAESPRSVFPPYDLLSLPLGPQMTKDQVDDVAGSLKTFCAEATAVRM